MTSGLTPIKDLRKEAFDDLEEGMSPSGISKLKKIKLSLKDTKTLAKHATPQQIEGLRLKKDKRLLIFQIKKLQQVLTDLGLETDLIERGNEELREMNLHEIAKVVSSSRKLLKEEWQKVKESAELIGSLEKKVDKRHKKLEIKAEELSLVEKRQVLEKAVIEKGRKLIERGRDDIRKAKKLIKKQKKQQKLNLERSEINFKRSEKRIKQVDTIYENIEKKRLSIKQAQEQVEADRLALVKKEERLETKEIALEDREKAIRRLAKEIV